MPKLSRLALIHWSALLLMSCARVPSAIPTTEAVAPAAQSPSHSSSVSNSASGNATAAAQAFVDPATGELRAPTEAELSTLNRQHNQSAAANSSTSSVRVTPLANGMVEYDLGTRAHVDEVVCVQMDGTLGKCTPAQIKALKDSAKP